MAVRVFSTTVGSISFVSLAVMGTRGLTSETVVDKSPGSLQSLGNPPSCFASSCRTPSTRMAQIYNRYLSVATIPAAFVRSPSDGFVRGFSRSMDRNSRCYRTLTGLEGGIKHLVIRRDAASRAVRRRRGDSWRLDSTADRHHRQDMGVVAETGCGKLSVLHSLRNVRNTPEGVFTPPTYVQCSFYKCTV